MRNDKNNLISSRTKHRDDKEKQELIRRINIIDGQIHGIKQMIMDDRYCDEIIIQLAAVNKAVKSLASKMLNNHFKNCVTEEISKGNLDIIDEIIYLLGRME
jgi:DNA-binding FrmR family transcriptional regulator